MNDIAFVVAGVLLGMLGLLLNDALRQRRQRRAQEAAELARHIERRRAEADRLRRRQDTQSAAKPHAPKARPAQAPKAKAKPAATTLLVVGEKPGSEKLELAERRCGQVRRIDAAHFKFMLEQDLTVSPDEFAACFAA